MRTLVLLLLSTGTLAADPVITLDYSGGLTPERIRKEPYLAIYADGTIRACNPFTKDKPREDRMSKEAVKKLAAELAPKLQQLKKYPGKTPAIVDASTTEMRVGKKSAKQYALGYLAQQLPKNKQIQTLWSAQKRLDRIYNVTMVGGEKKAKKHLATANKALKKEWPKAKPFTFDEMAAFRWSVTFRRQEGKRWIVVTCKDGKVHVDKGS